MPRVVVILWKAEDAATRVEQIAPSGWKVETCTPASGSHLKALRDNPPEAFVIDFSRMQSDGREVAIALRKFAATRHVPIVIAGGPAEKVERAQAVLPDALYCEWNDIVAAISRARLSAPEVPIVPTPMAGYSGTPLPKKLGISKSVALLYAPQGFLEKLSLPETVAVRERAVPSHRILFFIRSARDLRSHFDRAANAVEEGGGLWLIWPKKASGIETDVSEPLIREFGLARGWVDYKICAVDQTWSGLLFARKR